MKNRNPYPDASDWGPAHFARLVQAWCSEYESLLEALILARALGEAHAVEALLSVGEVRRLRLAWELWVAIREGANATSEPTDELRAHLGDAQVEWVRSALWGDVDAMPSGALRIVA